MKGPDGSPRLYLASSTTGKALVPNSEEKLHSVVATLERCRATLLLGGNGDTAQLLSVAILDLRIKLNRIDDQELKSLCDAVTRDVEAIQRLAAHASHESPRRRSAVSLKLVK